MDIFNVLSLFGGLALFLFGMGVMGEGLEKQAGGKLKMILEKLTENPYKGFLLGLVVTAIIQSSSATTVMVVGFVNSGVMLLEQAIGVIMGANVGTTVTAWILSLTGIQGDSFFIQMLKPSSFTPILALIGIILYTFSKSARKKDTGTILLGFAVLMYGMDTMSSAVEPLAEVEAFTNILTIFSNPILGVLAGAVLTGIIQSSSASVGILQALSMTGKITFGTAIPIILGQNIGTCVTALLSSIGANKNARRTAMVHLYFNIIGTILFLTLFYLLNAIIGFSFLGDSVTPVGIAIVHTGFNLIATLVMLPFSKQLGKLACLTIRDDDEKEKFQLLDERLLATPTLAIEQAKKLTVDMGIMAQDAFMQSIQLLGGYDPKAAKMVSETENQIDTYEDKLGSYLVKLSEKSLSLKDSREISKLLHSIGDFERIGDHALNVAEVALELHEKKIVFTNDAQQDLQVIIKAVLEALNMAITAFVDDDTEIASQVEPLEEVIDALRVNIKSRHIDRLQDGSCTIEMGFIYTDLLTDFERVADHCSNIAVCIIEINHDSFDTHQYLNTIRNSDLGFQNQYEIYKKKYALDKT